MSQETIEVHPDAELRRRIEEAAAKQNVPVEAYCLEAIEQKVMEDDLVEDVINGDMTPNVDSEYDTLIDDLRDLHERILARRGGKPLDIDILELVRSERDDELTSMR